MSSPKYTPVSGTVLVAAVVVLGFVAGYLTGMSNTWLMSIGFGIWVFLFIALLGVALAQIGQRKKPAKSKHR